MHRHPHGNEASRDAVSKLATLFYVVDAMADDVMLGLACEMANSRTQPWPRPSSAYGPTA